MVEAAADAILLLEENKVLDKNIIISRSHYFILLNTEKVFYLYVHLILHCCAGDALVRLICISILNTGHSSIRFAQCCC